MLIGGAIFIAATAFSVLTFVAVYNSPTGGYIVVVYGLIIYGAGDFLYGLAGLLGLLR
jgi:hypothetical protein